LNYTFKYSDGTDVSYYLRCLVVWPALHIFKCLYSTHTYNIYILYIRRRKRRRRRRKRRRRRSHFFLDKPWYFLI